MLYAMNQSAASQTIFGINVDPHGVEQAFMPAANLLKKSASAAEVPLLNGDGRCG
jgi:hypothetical protein